jgi:DNA-directed RNA polymerase
VDCASLREKEQTTASMLRLQPLAHRRGLWSSSASAASKVVVRSLSSVGKKVNAPTTLYAVNAELFETFRKIIVKLQSDGASVDVQGIKNNLNKSKDEMTLYERQVQLEELQHSDAVNRQAEIYSNLKHLGKGTSVKKVQRSMVVWYEALTKALEEELQLIKRGSLAPDRTRYAPYLFLLPVEQLAVLALDLTVSSILRKGNVGISTTNLTLDIGTMIETEVNLRKVKMSKDNLWAKRLLRDNPGETIKIYNKLKRILKDLDGWSWETKVGKHVVLSLSRLMCCNFYPG